MIVFAVEESYFTRYSQITTSKKRNDDPRKRQRLCLLLKNPILEIFTDNDVEKKRRTILERETEGIQGWVRRKRNVFWRFRSVE